MGRFEDYKTYKTALGGRLLEVEIGKIAEQANGQAVTSAADAERRGSSFRGSGRSPSSARP